MSDQPPALRPVPDSAESPVPAAEAPTRDRRDVPRWIPLALAVALVVCLALLVWSRSELGNQIAQLEERNATLSGELAARDRVISLQERRLDDIRAGLDGLRDLMDTPLQ